MQMSDGSKKVMDIVRAPVVNFIESDNETFEQLIELLGNKSFSPIHIQDDYSINYYGDPVNFRHTLGGKDGNVRNFSITIQNHYFKLMMDWSSQENETHWDVVFEDEPVDSQDPPQGLFGAMVEISGTWATQPDLGKGGTGDYSWQCTASGYCTLGDIWESNMDLTYWFDVSTLDNDVTMYIRVVDSNTYYLSTIDCGANTVNFQYCDSGCTTLKTWDLPFTIEIDEYYEFRIIAQGSRFDVYVNNERIGTVFDDHLVTGKGGLGGIVSSGTIDFDDITFKHAKSVVIQLPVGAYDISKIRMQSTIRSDDDVNADGTSRIVIAPDDPIEFRQTAIDGEGFNQPDGGEVKVWDTMGSVTESDWRRVYRLDRKFVGSVVIDNRMIRLIYERTTTQIKLCVYSDEAWEELTFLPDWSSLTFENVDFGIIELERYYVTLRELSYYETSAGFDSVWTDYTIRSGSPMVHIENRRAL